MFSLLRNSISSNYVPHQCIMCLARRSIEAAQVDRLPHVIIEDDNTLHIGVTEAVLIPSVGIIFILVDANLRLVGHLCATHIACHAVICRKIRIPF